MEMMEQGYMPYNQSTNKTMGFMHNPAMSENVKYILSPQDILFEIENFLRGIHFDKNKNEYIQAKQLVNEYGVQMIYTALQLRLSKIARMTRYDDKQIYNEINQLSNTLNDLLTWNAQPFGINEVDIDLIYHELLAIVYAALNQAKNGGLQDFFTKTAQMSEVSNLQPRGGLGDMFKSAVNKVTGKGGN